MESNTRQPRLPYGTWYSHFREALQPGKPFQEFFEQFFYYLDHLLQTGRIDDSEEDKTPIFLKTHARMISVLIASLQKLPEQDVQLIQDLLLKTIFKFSQLLAAGYSEIFDGLYCLLDPKASLYLDNGQTQYWTKEAKTSQVYQKVVSYAVETAPLPLLLEAISSDKPQLFHFASYVSILKQTKEINTNIFIQEGIKKIIPGFIHFLKEFPMSSLRGLDSTALKSVIMDVVTKDSSSELVDTILDFCNICLHCNFVDKSLLAARVLSGVMCDRPEFIEWSQKNDFISYVVETDLHSSVAEAIEPAFAAALVAQPLDQEKLMKLWKRFSLSHFTDQPAIFSLFMRGLTPELLNGFLESLNEEDTVLFASSLSDCRTPTTNSMKSTLRTLILRKLFASKNKKTINALVSSFSELDADDQVISETTNYFINEVYQQNINANYECILGLFCEKNIQMDYNHLLDVLINSNLDVAKCVSPILYYTKCMLIKGNQFITILSHITDESGWDILSKVFVKRGTKFLSTQELDYTIQFMMARDYQNVTLGELAFVLRFSIAANLSYSVLVLSVFLKSDNPIIISGIIHNLEIRDQDDIISIVNELTTSFFDGDVKSINKLSTLLTLLLDRYEVYLDLTEFGCQIHKQPSDSNYRRIILDSRTMGRAELRVLPEMPISSLIQAIGWRYGVNHHTLVVSHKTYELSKTSTVEENMILDNDTLRVDVPSNTYRNTHVFSIVRILMETDIIKFILGFLKKTSDNVDPVWELAMRIPTSPVVMKEIKLGDSRLAQLIPTTKSVYILRYLLQTTRKIYEPGDLENTEMACLILFNQNDLSNKLLEDLLPMLPEIVDDEDQRKILISKLSSLLIHTEEELLLEILKNKIIGYTHIYPSDVCQQLLSMSQELTDCIANIKGTKISLLSDVILAIPDNTPFVKIYTEALSRIDISLDYENRYISYILTHIITAECDLKPLTKLLPTRLNSLNDIFLASKVVELSSSMDDLRPLLEQTLVLLSKHPRNEALNSLVSAFCNHDPNARMSIQMLLEKLSSVKNDNYWFVPSVRSPLGFAGLKNHGATCYMNSVLQQLYSNRSFFVEFSKLTQFSKKADKWGKQLSALFWRLHLTSLESVDTLPFIETFSFDQNSRLDTQRQQDAAEFLQILLGDLDDAPPASLYQGKMVSHFEAEDYNTEVVEPFHFLSLDVQGMGSFEESIDKFLKPELLSNYYAESLDRRVNVKRTVRIREAPNHLVVQLNRFSYNIERNSRVKIDDYFQFPWTFDLSEMTENPEEPIPYELTGIVVHIGHAESGHYTSFVKVNNNWYLFNDSIVSLESEEDVRAATVGGAEGHENAYLLFYQKANLPKVEVDVEPPADLLREIQEENRIAEELASSYDATLAPIVLQHANDETLVKYFFNITLKSAQPAIPMKFVSRISSIHIDNELITEGLVNCISKPGREALQHLLVSLQPTDSLIKAICEAAKQLSLTPKRLNYTLKVLELITEEEVSQDIIDLAQTLMESLSLSNSRHAYNMSSLFRILSKASHTLPEPLVKVLAGSASSVLQSEYHVRSYITLIKDLSELGKLDVTLFAQKAVIESADSGQAELFKAWCNVLPLVDTKESFDSLAATLLNLQTLSKGFLVSALYNYLEPANGQDLLQMLQKFGGRMMFDLITYSNLKAVAEMEQVYLEIFADVPPLRNMTRAETLITGDQGFVWYDNSRENSGLKASDREYLTGFLNDALEGLKNFDEKCLVGDVNASTKLTHMLRVLFWMVIRCEVSLTKENVESIITFGTIIHRAQLIDDANVIELLRLFRVLKGPHTFEVYDERFDDLLKIAFYPNPATSDRARIVYFGIFFGVFRDFFVYNNDRLRDTLKDPAVLDCIKKFNVLSVSEVRREFLETIKGIFLDEFVRENLYVLIENHIISDITQIEYIELTKSEALKISELSGPIAAYVLTKWVEPETAALYVRQVLTDLKKFKSPQDIIILEDFVVHVKACLPDIKRVFWDVYEYIDTYDDSQWRYLSCFLDEFKFWPMSEEQEDLIIYRLTAQASHMSDNSLQSAISVVYHIFLSQNRLYQTLCETLLALLKSTNPSSEEALLLMSTLMGYVGDDFLADLENEQSS